MKKDQIDWKLLCKQGIVFGAFVSLLLWLAMFLNSNIDLDEYQFIQHILLIFIIPVFVLMTIIFGPLGDRAPSIFHGNEDTIIVNIIWYFCAFLVYFLMYTLIKYIKIKIKNKINKVLDQMD